MRNYLKRAMSSVLAVSLLGYAVMLSVGMAESPYRRTRGENAFERPIGHPEKALITAPWAQHSAPEAWLFGAEAAPSMPAAPVPTTEAVAFDWGFETPATCAKCAFKDSKVTPVVFDVPDMIGPSDATAIDIIKRKLGINSFRGTIFDGAEPPARQLIQQDAPARLLTLDRVLDGVDRCDESCSCTKATCATDQSKLTGGYVAKSDDDCPGATSAFTSVAAETPAQPEARVQVEDQDRGAVDALRSSSTQLDNVAKRLEDDDRYEEADAMREAAQQLRVLARGFKHATATSALREAPRWGEIHRPVGYGRGRPAVHYGYGWEVHDE